MERAARSSPAWMEEPFAVVHKVTLYVIIATERDRDATPTRHHVRRRQTVTD